MAYNKLPEDPIERARAEAIIAEEKRKTGMASAAVLAADMADIGSIFLMTGIETLKIIFEQITRYFMLPIAAVSSIILTILTWRQYYLTKISGREDNHLLFKAIIETIAAVGISVAVIGAFAATAAFAMAGPIIFAVMLGGKALFQLGSSIYFGYKMYHEKDPVKREEYRIKLKDSIIGTIVGALATAAVIAVMLFAKPALAPIGIVAGIIGAVCAVAKFIELSRNKKLPPSELEAASDDDIEEQRNPNPDQDLRFNNDVQNDTSLFSSSKLIVKMNATEPSKPQPIEKHKSSSASMNPKEEDKHESKSSSASIDLSASREGFRISFSSSSETAVKLASTAGNTTSEAAPVNSF